MSSSTRLAWSGMTHCGRFRANNEDAFLALTYGGQQVEYLGKTGEAEPRSAHFVFAVSDGMGGAGSGEFASRTAVDTFTSLMHRSYRTAAAGVSLEGVLGEAFVEIHRTLLRFGRSYEECRGMGATLSVAWFTPGGLSFGHIGDSRIYLLRPSSPLVQITSDHTHVGWMRRSGTINEREARSHPRRNALQQALGAGHQFLEPQVGSMPVTAGDRVLICSDGLVDGLWDRRIEEILGSAAPVETLAPLLVEEAVSSSGRDNVTAVVVESRLA